MSNASNTITITSYHADGTVWETMTAFSRGRAGDGYREDAWKLQLTNGKNIVNVEEKLDRLHPGWRDLPEASPGR